MPASSIVIFTNTLLDGGAEKQAVLLAKALHPNHNIILIVFYGEKCQNKLLEIIRKENIHCIRLSGNKFTKAFKLYSIFRKHRILITFSYLATTNFYSSIIGKITGVRFRLGGLRSSGIKGKKLKVQRFLHNRFLTASISNSHSGKKAMINAGFKPEKIFVIPNCIELDDGNKRTRIVKDDPSEIKILSVARFVAPKDYDTALYALRILLDKTTGNIHVKYVIVGYGELEQVIRSKINELSLNGHTEIILNPPDIRPYYLASDIYLSTSLFEGLSNSIMEAMSYSLPVVATDVGDNSYLVKDGISGFLCPVRSPERIAEKVLILIKDCNKRKLFGEESYANLINNYSFQTFQNSYEEFIARLSR
ncbi:MAG: glycosyltransferase [Bacteroidota bacterium]